MTGHITYWNLYLRNWVCECWLHWIGSKWDKMVEGCINLRVPFQHIPRWNFLTKISGHFLLLRAEGSGPREVHVWSPMFLGTRQQQCRLEVWLYMSNMSRSTLRLVSNSTKQWIVKEVRGNSNRLWEMARYTIGPIRQNFSLILEVVSEDPAPALMALDNLRLVDCFNSENHDSHFSSVLLSSRKRNITDLPGLQYNILQ